MSVRQRTGDLRILESVREKAGESCQSQKMFPEGRLKSRKTATGICWLTSSSQRTRARGLKTRGAADEVVCKARGREGYSPGEDELPAERLGGSHWDEQGCTLDGRVGVAVLTQGQKKKTNKEYWLRQRHQV